MAVTPRQYGRKLWVLRDEAGRCPEGAPSFESRREAVEWWADNQDAPLRSLPQDDEE